MWVPRREEKPRVCPKCKSPYWDKPRKKPVVDKGNVILEEIIIVEGRNDL